MHIMSPSITDLARDPALIARYGDVTPRCCDFPDSRKLRSDFGELDLRAAIRSSNEEPIPRPLAVYLRIPFCPCDCNYCDCHRVTSGDTGKLDRYLERVHREIELLAPLFDCDRPVRQLHLGGGTPNVLDLTRMSALMESLAVHFRLGHDSAHDIGIAINPRHAAADYVDGLARLGFNRVVVGIQDLDPDVQQAINCFHSVAHTRDVMDAARSAGFKSIGVDLICGLPRQTIATFERTLNEVVDMAPQHIAVHRYQHDPDVFEAHRRINQTELPDPATRLALFALAVDRLGAAGYIHLGMDQFARRGDELVQAKNEGTLRRDFRGYSAQGECDILPLGVSTLGRIGHSYSQSACSLSPYHAALDGGRLPVARGVVLDEDEIIRCEAISELICHGRLDRVKFSVRHRLIFEQYFESELTRLQTLADDGLITLDHQLIQVTTWGRILLPAIARCFEPSIGTPYSAAGIPEI